MSHNHDHILAPDFALPEHDILALKGPDAVTFAQAQFMNDVGALADGQWQWNGWLTPKGRVIALFALLRLEAQTLWLLLPDVTAGELTPLLQRYVFRSKVALASVDTSLSAGFSAPQHAVGAAFAVIDDSRIELDMGIEAGPRHLVIGGTPAPEDQQAAARWMQADLAHGLPRLPASQREQWTPQQLSLDRLRAFSVKKGCYPGQEIVARTHYLGQVKRGLALYETTSEAAFEVAAGSEVHAAARSIGSVACASGNLVLAVMPLDAPTEGLSAAGITLQARPLLGGLAR
ncbi:folate-binding protein [Thermomonas sp.]|uniref:CAF17-like 4Fe-4S cluster assembly/insertion protein YgfZ n=1 Tax=Thermomonas sp. TaxID=1971895 RepID=UPI002487804C|nr:folate-binding protein [Thermomonas sp.]MDI1253559.1 folate-binding protein [Thermomonas sp.]